MTAPIPVSVAVDGAWCLTLMPRTAPADAMVGRDIIIGTVTTHRRRARLSKLHSLNLTIGFSDRAALARVWQQVRAWRMIVIRSDAGHVRLAVITDRLMTPTEYRIVAAQVTGHIVAGDGVTLAVDDPRDAITVPSDGWTVHDGEALVVDDALADVTTSADDARATDVFVRLSRPWAGATLAQATVQHIAEREADAKALEAFVLAKKPSKRGVRTKWQVWQ